MTHYTRRGGKAGTGRGGEGGREGGGFRCTGSVGSSSSDPVSNFTAPESNSKLPEFHCSSATIQNKSIHNSLIDEYSNISNQSVNNRDLNSNDIR